jgi:Fe-S-cluster-containing dehydrogenase component
MGEKRIYLNPDLCCGCKSCAAACSYAFFDHSRISHGDVGEAAKLPMHCMHCELAACAEACPTKSMRKDEDGVVRKSNFLCVGCSSCVSACPFGVLPVDLKEHIPAKCDLCSDRLPGGKVPRCVASCTSGALSFEEVSDLSRDESKSWISGRMVSNAPFRRR